jgi:hypothetical protein
VIDRNDWLDIRQRTEDTISAARREYDRLAGSVTVLGDIPPSDGVREAWESWNVDRRRAARAGNGGPAPASRIRLARLRVIQITL